MIPKDMMLRLQLWWSRCWSRTCRMPRCWCCCWGGGLAASWIFWLLCCHFFVFVFGIVFVYFTVFAFVFVFLTLYLDDGRPLSPRSRMFARQVFVFVFVFVFVLCMSYTCLIHCTLMTDVHSRPNQECLPGKFVFVFFTVFAMIFVFLITLMMDAHSRPGQECLPGKSSKTSPSPPTPSFCSASWCSSW